MVNIKKVALGTIGFFIGYIIVAITAYVIPDLLDAIDMNNQLKIICWAMTIIIWTLAMLVVPAGIIIIGIQEKNEQKHIFGVTMGVLYAIFSLALAYFTWSWTTPMTAIFNDTLTGGANTFLLAIFWIGYIIIWVSNIIVIPYVTITEAKEN